MAYLKDNQVGAEAIPDDMLLASNPDGKPAESLELDSLDQVELALAIETEFNIGTPEDIDFQNFATVNDIVDFVMALLDDKPGP
ncbi:MAG: phosphopantetheine-binding protein [Dehalococcoidia bacterium]